MNINYWILHDSTLYYSELGFQRIEAPWTVTKAVSDITNPMEGTDWTVKEKNKVLVASGEQSFLYLYLKSFLPKGRFQTITPCFRNDSFDQTHTKYFMKNELIDTGKVNEESLGVMIYQALMFFRKYIPECEAVKTDNGYDIEWNGYELGSYGIRRCEYLEWVYGTGLAEPRLSTVLKIYEYGLPLKKN